MMISKVLKRQLKRCGLLEDECPPSLSAWKELLELVDESYKQYEEDRYLLERSIEISNQEIEEKIQKNKEMNVQLAQAGKLSSLGTLSSGIAHELNNPLTGIIGHIEILKKGRESEEKRVSRFDKCIKLARRMGAIIGHLRKLSRASKKEDFTTIDLVEPINDTFELLGRQLIYENIKYTISYDHKSEFMLNGDFNKIESVFQNLVTNSFHAFQNLEKKKDKFIKIELNLVLESGECRVSYSDNAGGMSPEVVNQVFDPFYTTKEVGLGTGLGMSISKQIIEEHGGSIACQSVEGEGTKFTINLPLAKDKVATFHSLSQINVEKFPKLGSSRKKIIFIDDEEDICEIYSTTLSDFFKVDSFSDPSLAQKKLEKEKYDLMITDIKMAEIDGISLARFARTIDPELRIIFISGHADAKLKEEIGKFPNSTFIDKPLPSTNDFIDSIRKTLN